MEQLKSRPTTLTASIKIAFWLYGICFFISSLCHLFEVHDKGIFPYEKLSHTINLYFSCVAVVDFVVIVLFFTRPIWALTLSVVIMGSNFILDLYAGSGPMSQVLSAILTFQLLKSFRVFVFFSAPFVTGRLKSISQNGEEASSLAVY